MADIPLTNAKTRLGELISRAAAGETVRITRRGRPVAQLTAIDPLRQRIDAAVLKALTDAMPIQVEPAEALVRNLRDDARH